MKTVNQALVAVMTSVGAIGKTRQVSAEGGGERSGPKYRFRGIDEFMNALYPELCAHGVLVLPEVLEQTVHYHDRVSRDGNVYGQTTHVYLRVRFTFVGPAGDTLTCTTAGEGADTSDKATNKAMSVALKYALMQSFMIPTEDMTEPDATRPEVGPEHDDVRWADPRAVQQLLDAISGAPDHIAQQLGSFCKDRSIFLKRDRVPDADLRAAEAELRRLSAAA